MLPSVLIQKQCEGGVWGDGRGMTMLKFSTDFQNYIPGFEFMWGKIGNELNLKIFHIKMFSQ